jgi:TolB protein
MSAPRKLLTNFDKALIIGIILGVLGICVLTAVFFFIWVNPPGRSVEPAPFGGATTATLDISAPDLAATMAAGNVTATPTVGVPTPVPSFSGDASLSGKIAFTCFVKEIDQICIMNADGSDRKQLTEAEGTAFYASLSPDGQTVYFSSRRTGTFEIYSIGANGKNFKRLTKNIGSLYAPELSPNGDWIVFTNDGNGLWVMKSDGSNPHAITSADDIDPTWSPDGSMIAFASSRTGSRQLFVMNADGSNVRQVTDLENMGGRSSWSPDGTKLTFYAGPAGDHDIYVINVDGTNLVQLTDGGDNLGPSWAPAGNWIAFTSFRDGNNEIYIIHPDGTSARRLTSNQISDWQPRWGK